MLWKRITLSSFQTVIPRRIFAVATTSLLAPTSFLTSTPTTYSTRAFSSSSTSNNNDPQQSHHNIMSENDSSPTNGNNKNNNADFFISINGQPISNLQTDATISIFDTTLWRGNGVFEVMHMTDHGRLRCLEKHLDRLEQSATALDCPLPPRSVLHHWIVQAAHECPPNRPGSLKLLATQGGGGTVPGTTVDIPSKVILQWAPIANWPATYTLYPLLAPWHCAGAPGWETPMKWTSYGPNVLSTKRAQRAGYTDALLLSNDRVAVVSNNNNSSLDLNACHLLEGPSFAVGWISHATNTMYVPSVETLGLLPSLTMETIIELATNATTTTTSKTNGDNNNNKEPFLNVRHGLYTLSQVLEEADEVFITSNSRGIRPVTKIGTHELPTCADSKVAQLATMLYEWEENERFEDNQDLEEEEEDDDGLPN